MRALQRDHVTGFRTGPVDCSRCLLHRLDEQNPAWRHAREANASGRECQLPMAKRTNARGE